MFVACGTAPPRFTLKPTDQQVRPGGTAVFRCQAEGSPPPTVFWTREGSQQLMTAGYSAEHYRVTADNTLSVQAVDDDSGYLVCSAVSEAGANTARAALQVSSCDNSNSFHYTVSVVIVKINRRFVVKLMARR